MELTLIQKIAIYALPVIFAITVHEAAHGYAARYFGDMTAHFAGRITLNPVRHIDPFGTILVPALMMMVGGILFGWAKPVPYNPYNLRDQKWGEAMVAAAGPATNLLLALIFGALIRLADPIGLTPAFVELSSYIVYINILLAFFNLIPIPPLDGSKIIQPFLPLGLQMSYRNFVHSFERFGLIGTFLFIFIFIQVLWSPFSRLVFSVFEVFTGLSGI